MSMREPRIVLIAGVWLAAAAAANAAAEPTSQAGGLEEVIVTAQKRSESEQSVPMSMTTFSSAALEQKSITDFFDYATKVPNLAFAPTGDGVGTARTVSIRGISGDNVTGFYIDDVPLPDSVDPRVLDIGHIEVLRGPQGTLYGARSMGGTVRVITKEPELSKFSATVHAGLADFNSLPGNGIGFPAPSAASTLPSPLTTTYLTQARFFNIPEGGTDWWNLYSLTLHWKTGIGEFVSSTAYFDRRVDETEDQSEFIWAAITSGICYPPNGPGPPAGTPYCNPPQPGPIEEIKDYQRFVEEARFASQLNGPIQFVVGAFFSDFHGRVPFASLYPPSEVPGLDAIFTGGPPNNPDGFPNLVFAQDFHTDVKEPAIFGELSWEVTKALKATVGLRWYQVKTTSEGFEEGLAVGGGKIVSPQVTDSETGTNPKFELDYHFSPDQMVYGLASKGFRPGGVVPIVPPGTPGTANDCVVALHNVNPNITLDDTRSFHSDSLWNYELGAKTAWLDHRLTLNAAGFYIKWPNIQQAVLLQCGFQFIANAGAAESKGGELELRAAATEHLQASLGVGYQDAKITEAGESAQAVGSPVFNVPEWTGNTSPSYAHPVSSVWNLAGEVDYSYVGSSVSSANASVFPRERPAYRLLDARLALSNGATEIALVGKNLTNEVTNLGDNRSIAAEVPGRPRLFLNQPRIIGVEIREHF